MSVHLHAGRATVLTLLGICVAFGRSLEANHEKLLSFSDRYNALLGEMSLSDAAADLEDAKMTDLTHSIQGVFGADAPVVAKTSLPSKPALRKVDPKAQNAVDVVKEVKAAVIATGGTAAAAQLSVKDPEAVKAAVIATGGTQREAEQVADDVKVQAAKAARSQAEKAAKAAAAAAEAAKVDAAKLAKEAKAEAAKAVQAAKISKEEAEKKAKAATDKKVEQQKTMERTKAVEVAKAAKAIKAAQMKANKTKAIEKAVVSMPFASFALDIPKPAQNQTEHKAINSTKLPIEGKAVQSVKHTEAPTPIKLRVSTKVVHTEAKVAVKAVVAAVVATGGTLAEAEKAAKAVKAEFKKVAKAAAAKPTATAAKAAIAQPVKLARAAKAAIAQPVKLVVAPKAKVAIKAVVAAVVATGGTLAEAEKAAKAVKAEFKRVAKAGVAKATAKAAKAAIAQPVKLAVPVGNASQVAENKTKKVSEAVVASMPMAGLFETPLPAQNQTKPKFPGNATVKAAFDKKAEDLEKVVSYLKKRLDKDSAKLVHIPQPEVPVAAGTFNVRLHAKSSKSKSMKKLRSAKGSEPMQPIIKRPKAKADWPTMSSIAAPVAKEGQIDKVAMGSTFAAVPVKKVQSVIAVGATIEHNAVSTDDAQLSAHLLPAASVLGWFSSFFSWVAGKPSPAVTLEAPAHAAVTHKILIPKMQDSERTARATQEEHLHIVAGSDPWSEMEQEDGIQEQAVRREDVTERESAETAEAPHKPTQAELQGRHGAHMSGFWRKLEKQDWTIERTVHDDDVIKANELSSAEDEVVSKASDELSGQKMHIGNAPLKHHTDERLAIHEPWLRKEKRDKVVELSIHDSPDLQMLQLSQHHRRK